MGSRAHRLGTGYSEPFLKDLEYHNEFARRWYPLGKDEPVVIDPDYSFGLPVVVGSGVRTESIAEQYYAGDRSSISPTTSTSRENKLTAR